MSNKLNAEELAAKRYTGDWDGELGGYYVCRDTQAPKGSQIFIMSPKSEGAIIERMNKAYAAAIREVAQPIADQRDELLSWLIELTAQVGTLSPDGAAQISPLTLRQCRAAIAKATQP